MSGPYDPNEIYPVVQRLRLAFEHEVHDLWDGAAIYADHEHLTAIRLMKLHGMERLSNEEIDNMMAWSMAGAGGAPTFRFFLWRFLTMVLTAPSPAWTVDVDIILPKLDLAGFGRWPKAQQAAVVLALELWSVQRVVDEITLYAEPDVGAYGIRDWVRTYRAAQRDQVDTKP
jgi:hypothetical protein